MSRIIVKGALDQSIYFTALDSASTTGGRKTGIAHNAAGLTAYYTRNRGAATSIALASLAAADSAHSDGGWREIDSTNAPGLYRLDLPDAAVASGADSVVITIKGATGMVQVDIEIQLLTLDIQTANVAANITQFGGSNGTFSGGRPEVNSTHWGGTAVGSATVRSDLINISGVAVSTSTAQLGVNVVNAGGTAWGSGAITAASLATGAITAAKFAAGAVDAAALATDAVAEIADGVWDEPISGHLTAGSTGAALNAAGAAGDPWSTLLPGAYGAGTAGKIIGDNIDAAISSRSTYAGGDTAGTTTLLSRLSSARAGYLDNINNAALATTVAQTGDAFARLGAPAGASVSADVAAVKAQTAAIEVDTQDIQTRLPAALVSGRIDASVGAMAANVITDTALASSAVTEIQTGLSTLDAAGVRTAVGLASANLDTQLAAIDDYIDTEVSAIKAKTDLLSFTSGRVDVNVEAVNASTTAVDVLDRVVRGNVRGTVDTGASATSIPTSSLSPAAAVIDQFKGRILVFDDSTATAALRGQATDITASTAGGTLTVTSLTTAPASGDTFTIS